MSNPVALGPARPEPQASDLHRLLVAWQNPDTRRIALVGILEQGAGRYCFRYLRAALDTPGFRPFLLHLRLEPDNEFNPLAVLVTADDDHVLGWVPDLLADYVQHVLLTGAPTVRVSKVNGEDTSLNLRLLVELSGRLPLDYRPFGALADQTLA